MLSQTHYPAVSPEEQFAEKFHDCALPEVGRENTCVKNLVDLILLIGRTELDAAGLGGAVQREIKTP